MINREQEKELQCYTQVTCSQTRLRSARSSSRWPRPWWRSPCRICPRGPSSWSVRAAMPTVSPRDYAPHRTALKLRPEGGSCPGPEWRPSICVWKNIWYFSTASTQIAIWPFSPLENIWISGVCKRSHPEALLTRYLQRNVHGLFKCQSSVLPVLNPTHKSWNPQGYYRIVLAWLLEYFSHANFQSSLSPNLTPAEYAIQRRLGATGVSSSLYAL